MPVSIFNNLNEILTQTIHLEAAKAPTSSAHCLNSLTLFRRRYNKFFWFVFTWAWVKSPG